MTDFESARTKMVDNQIRTTDVTSHSILSAFLTVPREAFVPENLVALAYIDTDIKVAPLTAESIDRYIMEPSPLAKLIQLAEIGPSDSLLVIGAEAGYAAAILSKLARSVVALESNGDLAEKAAANLTAQGCANVAVVKGALQDGCAENAPYDVIFINGAVQVIPEHIFGQLRDGGRLVAVMGYGNASSAVVFVSENGVVSKRFAFNTSVKPLPGFEKAPEFAF